MVQSSQFHVGQVLKARVLQVEESVGRGKGKETFRLLQLEFVSFFPDESVETTASEVEEGTKDPWKSRAAGWSENVPRKAEVHR